MFQVEVVAVTFAAVRGIKNDLYPEKAQAGLKGISVR